MIPPKPERRGLTLVEVLVVLAIVGLLVAMTAAAVMKSRAASSRLACANNMRQVGLSLVNYHDTLGSLPPGLAHPELLPQIRVRIFGPDRDPFPWMNWRSRLLPYLDQDALWQELSQGYTKDRYFLSSDAYRAATLTQVAVFSCPTDDRRSRPGQSPELTPAQASYLGIEGINHFRRDGLLFLDSYIQMAEVTDGTSNTLLVGERPPSLDLRYGHLHGPEGHWGTANSTLGVREMGLAGWEPGCAEGPYSFRPGRLNDRCSAFHYWSAHSSGANFLFADGSVRFLAYSAAPHLPEMATRAGGEPIPSEN